MMKIEVILCEIGPDRGIVKKPSDPVPGRECDETSITSPDGLRSDSPIHLRISSASGVVWLAGIRFPKMKIPLCRTSDLF